MKVKDGIVGFVVGDALGVPVEFSIREELQHDPVIGMRGGGTYDKPKGTWSDDSSMILATMTSIANKKSIDYEDIIHEFLKWYQYGEHTTDGDTFDYGMTSSTAIERYTKGIPVMECGGKGEHDNGNGSLMRILPLAFIKDIDYNTIETVSSLTHATERAKIACVFYVQIAQSMLENDDLTIRKHIEIASDKIRDYYNDSPELECFNRIFTDDFSQGIVSSGYVIYTLESVVYCLETTDNYRDAVLKAVNLGGDTDTIGGLCGGLAGIYYGFDAIPIDWVDEINRLDYVLSLCERYEEIL